MEFALEPLTDELEAEFMEMAGQYWHEVSGPFHSFPPDVAWDIYRLLASRGQVCVVVGRVDGKAKAGAVATVTPHPHYACIAGTITLLFVDPAYRKGTTGIRLVKAIESATTKAGAQLIVGHGGVHNGVYRLFEYMHYQDFGRYYVKVCGDGPNGLNPIFKDKKEG